MCIMCEDSNEFKHPRIFTSSLCPDFTIPKIIKKKRILLFPYVINSNKNVKKILAMVGFELIT